MKKTWQKQTCIKIKYPTLHNNVLQELRNIVYDKDGPSKAGVEMWIMNRLQYILASTLQLMSALMVGINEG